MSTSFYWRDCPRTHPRRPGQYLVTYELPFTDGPEVGLDTWDGISWGYKSGITGWMPCPLPYKNVGVPNFIDPFQNEEARERIDQTISDRLDAALGKPNGDNVTQTEYYR